ncbi:MAG: diguanylate cyclase [Candidatus Aminicenantales bacterium]|jgi:diguanylate cyclase (GGDEF)-like protein/PAS domain S-box-containing protein
MSPRNEFYRDVLDNLFDGVYFVDRERRITFWSKTAEKMTGYEAREVVGRRCADNILVHVDGDGTNLCEGLCPLARTIEDGEPREADVFLHHRKGHRMPVSVRVAPIRDADGRIMGGVEVFSDNSRRLAEAQQLDHLKRLALLDPMTEIRDRGYMEISLQAVLKEVDRYSWPMGLLFVDIDRFKRVNDSYGHEAGDQILKAVAQTLVQGVRAFDIVGRWGGEEFVLIIRNITEKNLGKLAEKLRALVAKSFVTLAACQVGVTVSIGATTFLPDDTAEGVISRADALMSRGKAAGRNRVTLG